MLTQFGRVFLVLVPKGSSVISKSWFKFSLRESHRNIAIFCSAPALSTVGEKFRICRSGKFGQFAKEDMQHASRNNIKNRNELKSNRIHNLMFIHKIINFSFIKLFLVITMNFLIIFYIVLTRKFVEEKSQCLIQIVDNSLFLCVTWLL